MKKRIIVIVSILSLIITLGLSSFTTREYSQTTLQAVCVTYYTPSNYGTCIVEDPILETVYTQMNVLLTEDDGTTGSGSSSYAPHRRFGTIAKREMFIFILLFYNDFGKLKMSFY